MWVDPERTCQDDKFNYIQPALQQFDLVYERHRLSEPARDFSLGQACRFSHGLDTVDGPSVIRGYNPGPFHTDNAAFQA